MKTITISNGAAAAALAVLLVAACGPMAPTPAAPPPPGVERIPPVPAVDGPLAIDVVWPPEDHTLAVDSTFVFGNLGTGRATLTINGAPVEVAPNGAWLAFLPVPQDGRYELVARRGEETERLVRNIERAQPARIDAEPGRVGVVPGTLTPAGILTGVRGEPVEVAIQATPGAEVHLVLPDGRRIRLHEQEAVAREAGFMLDRAVRRQDVARYVGTLVLDQELLFEDPEADEPAVPLLTRREGYVEVEEMGPAVGAVVEVAAPGDTVRIPLETTIGILDPMEPRVGRIATARADSMAVGQRRPGGDQEWEFFWPNGTLLTIDGEDPWFYRVRVTEDRHTYVNKDHVELLPEGTPLPRGDVGPSIGITHAPETASVRFSMTTRLPYQVTPEERRVTVDFYGATGRPAYVSYGDDDTFVERLHWEQVTDEHFRFHIDLRERLWGMNHRFDRNGNLVVDVRRAPRIDRGNPFRGLHLAIDAGHPPGGATGPTRLTEADANLSITRRLVPMLERRGATITELRPDTATVGLMDRVVMGFESDAHLFVSVHFNAFPDGVNPFENQGTINFYYWPQSVDFARHFQRELVAEVGLPDRGIRFQNLALPRIWWMPSVLTETLFMMIPEHEAALRDERFQQRIAEAHLRAMERFLIQVADEQAGG
jgi:N-acetylmuramoyl-L-alanine amidase